MIRLSDATDKTNHSSIGMSDTSFATLHWFAAQMTMEAKPKALSLIV